MNHKRKLCARGIYTATIAVICVISSFVYAQEINPCPRQVLRSDLLQRWSFQNATGGWTAAHDCAVAPGGSALQIQATGHDPYLHSPPIHVEGR